MQTLKGFTWLLVFQYLGEVLAAASAGGAAWAMQVHPVAGAYAGLALGIQVVMASIMLPLAARLF